MLSFEDEVRAYLKHRGEQDPTLHALEQGEMTTTDIDVEISLQLLARVHSALIIRTAQEIDKLRAATDSG
jgi:hypothetical protein